MNDTIKEEVASPVAEETTQADKLSRRDAIAQAIQDHKEEPTVETSAPSKEEVKQAVDADPEPPSEFSASGRDAWAKKDIRGIQAEYKRIHDGRTQELTRAQRAERDALERVKPATQLVEKVREYLTLRGDGEAPTEKQIAEAVQLVAELKKNPKAAKAELEKLGFDFSGDGAVRQDDTKITALQRQVEALQQKEQNRTYEVVLSQFDSSFKKLGSERTRTGDPVFPDLFDESEKGKQFATDLGSLASDSRFVAGVLRRFPDADHSVLVREAYKYLGGRVSEAGQAKASVSQSNQDIDKKRRAAASTPGRPAPSNNGDALKGKLSRRAAIIRALEEQREH